MNNIKPLEFCVNVTIPTVDSSGMSFYQCLGALASAVQDFADQLNAAGLNNLSGDTLPLHSGGSTSIAGAVETNKANAESAILQVNGLTFRFNDLKNDVTSKQAEQDALIKAASADAERAFSLAGFAQSGVSDLSNNVALITSKQAEHDALIKSNTNQANLNQQDNILNKAAITKLNNLIFESESAVFPNQQTEIKKLYESGVRLIIAAQGSGKMKIGYIVQYVDSFEILEVG